MQRLTGEFQCKVDAKGRLRIPSSLVRQLGSDNLTFTINRGFEKHLILYPKMVWDKNLNPKILKSYKITTNYLFTWLPSATNVFFTFQ